MTAPRLRRATTRTDAWGKRRTPAERKEWRRMQWRWRLAALLDRSRRSCWTSLVGWAQSTERTREHNRLRATFNGGACGSDEDFRRNGLCYCGKFRDLERWPT